MIQLFKERKEKLNLFKARHKLNKIVENRKINVPDGLYTRCPGCGNDYLSDQTAENIYVCPG